MIEFIAQKQKKAEELAAARANAPVAKVGIEYRLKDNMAKNRNGPCGKVPLVWCGSTMT